MGGKCVEGVELLVKPQRDKKTGDLLGPNVINSKHGTPKCEFIAQLLRCDESNLSPECYSPTWVGAHPSLGEAIAKHMIVEQPQLLEEALPDGVKIDSFQSQVTFELANKEKMRADFMLQQSNGRKRIVEVKTVVDTDYSSNFPLPNRSRCIFTSNAPDYTRTAIFPWGQSNQKGPNGEKVVSARAIKHVTELTAMVDAGDYDATVLFIVIRGDAQKFRPNHQACPSFAKYLKQAESKGVQILAKRVRWGEERDNELGNCYNDDWLDIEWPEQD
jgi:DNA-binding sugar fermentation-stimulating protein